MLSSVFVTGVLAENKGDGVRIVDVESYIPGPSGFFQTQHIPVYCRLGAKTFFFTAPSGSLITVKGRLELKEPYGLVVVNEIDEIYTNKAGAVKSTVVEQ